MSRDETNPIREGSPPVKYLKQIKIEITINVFGNAKHSFQFHVHDIILVEQLSSTSTTFLLTVAYLRFLAPGDKVSLRAPIQIVRDSTDAKSESEIKVHRHLTQTSNIQ